jgi:hypothetical protein
MDAKERFKVAVLALCADQGMSLGETLVLTKHANQTLEKQADPKGTLASLLGLAKGPVKTLFYAGALAPPVVGGVAGWGAARATSGINERTSDEVKHQEMIDELRRQTANIQARTAAAQRRKARESQRGSRLL